ncbi:MAG: thioredoxin domain-containing protein [Planctomycetes bacterium]|nr:thioredoxin domain-containing protein [Planctomycetota bacterium]
MALQVSGCGNNNAAEPAAADSAAPDAETAEKPKEQPDEKKHTNHLAKETSLYLRMHAHNPVDWYPWNEEALAKAKKENKVIFLSIGYSSCHWCHVMERESFVDKEIAKFLNENFVCIKVDREERPDVDSVYMTSLHVLNQLTRSGRGGGWPLSMFLTPDAKPFFGGTYFPARDGDRGQATGFLSIVKRVKEVWDENPDKIKNDADTITRFTKTQLEGEAPGKPIDLNVDLVKSAQQQLDDQYDAIYGGFGYDPRNPQRPKFPEPSNLFLLIERVRVAADERAKRMLVGTLERMAMGGIRDHVGGGFHRYSVDRFWQIPHFEKMLYDNGQLASVYAETYALTGRKDFRRVVE